MPINEREMWYIRLVIGSIVLCFQEYATTIKAMSGNPKMAGAVLIECLKMNNEIDSIYARLLQTRITELGTLLKLISMRVEDNKSSVTVCFLFNVTLDTLKRIVRRINDTADSIELISGPCPDQRGYEKLMLEYKVIFAMAHHLYYEKTDTVEDPSKQCWLGSLGSDLLLTIFHYL